MCWKSICSVTNKQNMDNLKANNNHHDDAINLSSPPISPNNVNVVVPPTYKKTFIKALFDFVPYDNHHIGFKKDDILELLNDDGVWWKARFNNVEGFIPSNYVQKCDGGVKSLDCYFEADRRESERNLLLPGYVEGTYLIRPSSFKHAKYTLSIRYQQNENHCIIKHYMINEMDDGRVFIAPRLVFPTMTDMIRHYSSDKDGLCHNLTQPCPKVFRPPVEFRDMEVHRESFTMMTKLGSGSFGDVWKAKWNRLVEVAIKTIKAGAMEKEAFIAEAEILHQMRHPKIVQIVGVCTVGDPIYIITEFMVNGTLLSYLKSDGGNKILFPDLIDMLQQIAYGMSYLENKNCVHRDLRATNILVGENNTVKVANFGLAKMIEDYFYIENTSTTFTKFPVKWTPMEAYMHSIFSVKSDVWSFGILCYELLTYGMVPYPGMTNEEVMQQVASGYRMEKPKGFNVKCDDTLYSVMMDCWKEAAEQRPTFKFLKDFFENYTVSTEVQYQ